MKKSQLRQIIQEEIVNELFGSTSKNPEDIANGLKIYFQIAFETGLESLGSYDDFEKEFWDKEKETIIRKLSI